MAQTQALIDTLKRQLKAHGKTYQDVAEALDLSEASVKRLFAEGNLNLQRLETICDLMELDFGTLAQLMNEGSQKLSQLNAEQETEIVNDLLLLLIALCVVNGYGFRDILKEYRLSEHDCIQKLAKLDRLKIIDLLPGNRVKLKIAPNFRWLPNGPIQRFFQERIKAEFFQSRFDQPCDKLLVVNGLLGNGSNAELQKRMQKLTSEFTELARDDRQLGLSERHGTTLVVALRQWQSSLFDEYTKSSSA